MSKIFPSKPFLDPGAKQHVSYALVSWDDLARYSDHPSAYLVMNEKTQHFSDPRYKGFIGFRSWGDYVFQICNCISPIDQRQALLQAFCDYFHHRGKKICVLQLQKIDISLYQRLGFRINQLGTSYTLDLMNFRLAGTRFMNLRNKIHHSIRQGVTVVEVGREIPRNGDLFNELQHITGEWLTRKGRGKKLLEFLVGELGNPQDLKRRIFVAIQQNKIVAFVTYVPCFGAFAGVMHDLSRSSTEAAAGTMELINYTAIERFRDEHIPYLHFGLTPCVGISPSTDCVTDHSKVLSRVLNLIAQYGHQIYPAKSQMQYKLKWGVQLQFPEYVAFEGTFHLGTLWALLRLTHAV